MQHARQTTVKTGSSLIAMALKKNEPPHTNDNATINAHSGIVIGRFHDSRLRHEFLLQLTTFHSPGNVARLERPRRPVS